MSGTCVVSMRFDGAGHLLWFFPREDGNCSTVSWASGGQANAPATLLDRSQEEPGTQEQRESNDRAYQAPRHLFVTAHVEQLPFPEALELITQKSSSRADVAYAQQQDGCFLTEYTSLAKDAEEHIPWATEALGCVPEAVNIWIGNERAVTSFHKDHYENLYAVVVGEKHFTLLPPTDVHRMYMGTYPPAQYVRQKVCHLFFVRISCPQSNPQHDSCVVGCSLTIFWFSDRICYLISVV